MKQVLIAFDQLINTVVYVKADGFGYADETLSARAWRLRDESSAYKLINALFFWQNNHCRGAYESEINNSQLPEGYR